MGFKTFTVGEVLTASDVNGYLMKQAVIVATSGTRPSSPVEGMTIYETDTDCLLSYDGAAWRVPTVRTVEKSGDTTRTSTITRTADPDLALALPANSTWEFTGALILTSAANAAGDFSYEWQFPASATLTAVNHGMDIGLASGSVGTIEAVVQANQTGTSPTTAQNYGCSTTQTGVIVTGRIVLAGTAGSLTLAWAQQSSNASGTTLQNGSYITARRVV